MGFLEVLIGVVIVFAGIGCLFGALYLWISVSPILGIIVAILAFALMIYGRNMTRGR